MDTHYVCTGGCESLSEKPSACSDESCLMYNMDFAECACEDSQHREVMQAKPDDMDLEEDEEGAVKVDEDELVEWENKLNGTETDEEEERWN